MLLQCSLRPLQLPRRSYKAKMDWGWLTCSGLTPARLGSTVRSVQQLKMRLGGSIVTTQVTRTCDTRSKPKQQLAGRTALASRRLPYLALSMPAARAVPVRVGESSVRVQDLRVRFFDVGTLYQPPPEVRRDQA